LIWPERLPTSDRLKEICTATNAAPKNYEEAVAIYRAAGDVLDWAHTVRHVGDILRNMGRKDLAGPCFRTAPSLYRGDARTAPLDLANTLRGYDLLTDDNGESVRATPLWQEARDLYAAVGADVGVKESSRRLALQEHQ
jgi:tetratricopeptide (TPR) repeat protein